MCDTECYGRYKDQKAYSYWDSGFVGPIYIYEMKDVLKICFYALELSKYGLLSIKRVKPNF